MNEQSDSNRLGKDRIFDAGAAWFVKKERGLSASEADELEKALDNDAALGEAIKGFEETKEKVGRLPADFVKEMLSEEAPKRSWMPSVILAGTVAALLMLGISLTFRGTRAPQTPVEPTKRWVEARAAPKTHLLPDGSLVRLNTGSRLEIAFGPTQRRIVLLEGEALFEVTPDSKRSFVVVVDEVEIRAVGTAFNVNRVGGIDVIVTHGIVEIFAPPKRFQNDRPTDAAPGTKPGEFEKFVSVGQRAQVVQTGDRTNPLIEVIDMGADEVESFLDWRKSLLSLSGENLVEMAASFEQKTGYRLVIADPSLKKLRIGGRFPSNDVFGFLRILNTGYGIPWRQDAEGVIILGNRIEEE